jgi:hypothetical protein
MWEWTVVLNLLQKDQVRGSILSQVSAEEDFSLNQMQFNYQEQQIKKYFIGFAVFYTLILVVSGIGTFSAYDGFISKFSTYSALLIYFLVSF